MELWFYKEQNEQLMSEASTHGRANRLDDLRTIWASSGQPLNIMGNRAAAGNKVYFRGLR